MQEGTLGVAHRLNDAVHLLSGGFWIGALAPLYAITANLPGPCADAARLALRRFSSLGVLAVVSVAASGLINMRLVLGHWPTEMASPYQVLLALKLALVAAMVAVAIANRIVATPGSLAGEFKSIRLLRYGIAVEVVLGFAIVAIVAIVAQFGTLDPT